MTILEEPEWQDKDRNRVEFESDVFGCKLARTFSRTDILLLGDKFGGNIDMTGNGHIVGEKSICEKCCIVQRKATKTANHFTFIGITNLLG